MSINVVQRRGNTNVLAPRTQTNGETDENGQDHDKRKKHVHLTNNKPVFIVVATIVSLIFVIGLVFILPASDDASELRRSPSIPVEKQAPDKQQSRAASSDPVHQTIFSTGCSTFQDWQSYIFFFHAFKVGQPGYVTRIASGCTPKEAQDLKRLHKERIEIMSDRFRLHLTPEFSTIKTGFRYKFFNKPYGVRHWLEHGLGYPNNTEHDDDIVILLDPDQMLLRPMTNQFENDAVDWKRTKDSRKPITRVQHGFPAGQLYGFAAQWKTKVNVTHVTGESNSPIENVTMQQARDYYPLGPPYMATARDFYQIALKWTEFVPRVHDDYSHLLAEMFAYSLAAAHLRLPHQVAHSFMVSDTTVPSEGWKMLDSVPEEDVCYAAPQKSLPFVLHYCQRYLLGKWFIGKYRLPKNFISCESPMLMEPPSDIGMRYNYSVAPFQESRKYYNNQKHVHRHVFMICTMIKALNEASEYFKKHNCEEGRANLNKSLIFHDTIED